MLLEGAWRCLSGANDVGLWPAQETSVKRQHGGHTCELHAVVKKRVYRIGNDKDMTR